MDWFAVQGSSATDRVERGGPVLRSVGKETLLRFFRISRPKRRDYLDPGRRMRSRGRAARALQIGSHLISLSSTQGRGSTRSISTACGTRRLIFGPMEGDSR